MFRFFWLILALVIPLEAATHPYTISRFVSGSGSVVLEPEWPLYAKDEVVKIIPIADPGHRFIGWATDSGYLAVSDSLIVSQSVRVQAVFVDTAEMVNNGEFLMEWRKWERWNYPSITPNYAIKNGSACLRPGKKGQPTYLQFFQPVRPMKAGVDYRVSFSVSASSRRIFQTLIRDNGSGWTIRQSWTNLFAEPRSQRYVFDFNMPSSTDIPRLTFELGGDTAEICLDNISLKAIPPTLVAPSSSSEEGILLASMRDRLVVSALSGTSWELRRIDGSALMRGSFESAGRQILPDIPRATSFLVLRSPDGSMKSFRVVRF